jgi:hypothetical protein
MERDRRHRSEERRLSRVTVGGTLGPVWPGAAARVRGPAVVPLTSLPGRWDDIVTLS